MILVTLFKAIGFPDNSRGSLFRGFHGCRKIVTVLYGLQIGQFGRFHRLITSYGMMIRYEIHTLL
jgi:hypothetical protein